MKTKELDPIQMIRRDELAAMSAKHNAAWQKHATHSRSGSSATIEQQAAIKAECGFAFTNALRAELETLLFLSTPLQKEFVYPSQTSTNLTGFMGNILMQITRTGREFRSVFGDKRQCVRACGINGAEYYGTIYGTYARMTPCKSNL